MCSQARISATCGNYENKTLDEKSVPCFFFCVCVCEACAASHIVEANVLRGRGFGHRHMSVSFGSQF